MQPALWVSKTGLDAQQTNIATIPTTLPTPQPLALKKGGRCLKICFTKTLTSREHNPRKTLVCRVV